MNAKSASPIETHKREVEKIKFYLLWSRRLFVEPIAVVVVNLILTYRLIFHPSKPSPSTYAQYYPQIHA
jgi:hypothetical protein